MTQIEEEKATIGRWMRTGETTGLDARRETVKTPIDGEIVEINETVITIPPASAEEILRLMNKLSSLSQLAEKEMVDHAGLPYYTCYLMVKIGVDELNDIDLNLGDVIFDSMVRGFAYSVDKALATGDGSMSPDGTERMPRGIMHSGCSAMDGEVTAASLKALLGEGVCFMMNSHTEFRVRALKEDGEFIWVPCMKDDDPNTLHGRPVYNQEDLPDGIIVAGDFSKAIHIRGFRNGFSICRLTNMYDAKGLVGFQLKCLVDLEIRPEFLTILHCHM